MTSTVDQSANPAFALSGYIGLLAEMYSTHEENYQDADRGNPKSSSDPAPPAPFGSERWLLSYKQTHADMEELGLAAWKSIQAKDVHGKLRDFQFEVESEVFCLLSLRTSVVDGTRDEADALLYAAALLGNRHALEQFGHRLVAADGMLPFPCHPGADPQAIADGISLLIELSRDPPDILYQPEIFRFYSKPILWQDIKKELQSIGLDVDQWRTERGRRYDDDTLKALIGEMAASTVGALREGDEVDALFASFWPDLARKGAEASPDDQTQAALGGLGAAEFAARKVVLKSIGDGESNDGKSAKNRYGRLLSPMTIKPAKLSPDACFALLNEEFPWLEAANAEIAGAVALNRSGNGYFFCPPLLLDGPPGIGKTRWARRIGEIFETGWGWLSLAGAHSAMLINGAERGWSGGHPCFAVDALLAANCANPIILLDEVDKTAGGGHNGDPVSALLPLLTVETAARFRDNFLMGEIDLSSVTWVLTSNDYHLLPETLLDRVEIIPCPAPDLHHIPRLITAMSRDVAKTYGIPEENIPQLDIQAIVDAYESKKDLRSLERRITRMIKRALWVKGPVGWDSPAERQRSPIGFSARPMTRLAS